MTDQFEVITRQAAKARGATRFFTGRPCKRGHLSERSVVSKGCVACMNGWRNEKRAAPYAALKDVDSRLIKPRHAKQVGQLRYFTGRRCPNGHVSERLVSTRGCLACAVNATERWVVANNDKFKAVKRAHRMRTVVVSAAQRRVWNASNPEKVAQHKRQRYARQKGAAGSHTAAESKALYRSQNGLCAGCRISLAAGYHEDHVMPLSLGGTNFIDNIQMLCPPCNGRKGSMHPDLWQNAIQAMLGTGGPAGQMAA